MNEIGPEIARRASAVRLILLDCDGVLTDGRIIVLADGGDARAFHVRDGLGIRLAQRAGLLFGIVSGRSSTAVAERAAELKIDELHQGISDKGALLAEILTRHGLTADQVAYVGDDLIDVPLMRRVGFAAAPSDAEDVARGAAHYVSRRAGGRGAVREVIDLILKAAGLWESATAGYRG